MVTLFLAFHSLSSSFNSHLDRLRPLAYPHTDLFMTCFSVMSPISYKNVKTKWWPEVTHYEPGARLLVVGTKADLRDNAEALATLQEEQHSEPLTPLQGEHLARDIKAEGYVECSALTRQGLNEVFETAIRVVTAVGKTDRGKKTHCNLL
ncbi:Rho GTPase [Pelomyxa schiedti]|nr:Rho GTPase [Pelomyxa schiedti]